MRAAFFFYLLVSIAPIPAQEIEKDKENTSSKEQENPVHKRIKEPFYVTVEESLSPIASDTTIATKYSVPIHQIPASVKIIPQSLFKSQDSVVLSDALVNSPGVNIQTNFGVHDLFFIRGFDSLSSGLVMTDTVMEPEATFYHLYNIDKVELLLGPSTFLHGGGPLSGAVNLIRKQPRVGEKFFQGAGTFGSFGTAHGQFDLNLGSQDSPVSFRLNAMGQRSEGYRQNRENYQIAVNPVFQWKASSSNTFTVNFEYLTNKYTPDSGLPLFAGALPTVSRRISYGSGHDDSDQNIIRFRFDWDSYVSNRIRLRTKIYYTDLDWLSNGTLINGVIPNFETGDLEVVRILNRLDDRQKLLGVQLESFLTFNTGVLRHELLMGFEANRLTDDFLLEISLLPTLNLVNPHSGGGDEPLFHLSNQDQKGSSRSRILAPYVVDRIQLSDQVHLFFGGRLDFLDYREEFSQTQRDAIKFNPMAGIIFEPRSDISFYVNGGSSFSPPSSLVRGERKPEESWQMEGGVRKNLLGDRVQGQLAVYHLQKTNIAIPDPNGVLREMGSQRSRGIEFSVNVEHLPLWTSFANYSFNQSYFTEFTETSIVNFYPLTYGTVNRTGNRSPFAPQHILNLWSHRQFSSGFGVGLGSRFVNGQFIAPDNQFKLDDYLVFDVVISYGVRNWKISINLKNITNQEYELRGFGANSVIPADGFGAFATLTFTR